MKYRQLGRSGIKASTVGFGTWAIGGWMWGGSDESAAIKAIHAALDSGINLIDTAPVYGFGESEKIVGKAIHDRRDKVVLATKCGIIWHEERGEFYFASNDKEKTDDGNRKAYRSLTPANIRYEIEQSLRRLKTDYIDLYQTHWQESTTPISETMGTLLELKTEGKIRAIGCCNAEMEQLNEYRKYGQLDCDQELFSMLDRKHEKQNIPIVEENEIAFLAFSPLAQGLLTGKIGPDRTFGDGDLRNSKPRFEIDNRYRIQELLQHFDPIAKRLEASLGQLAIAWTISRPGCSHALVGARTVEQAMENIGGASLNLTDDDITAMDEALDSLGKAID